MKLKVLVAAALVVVMASVAAAQFGRFQGGFGGFRRYPPRYPKADSFGHGFNFCRAIYTSTRAEAGGQGWGTDYPDADLNFSIRLSELTRARVSMENGGRPDYLTVRLTDDSLFQCPYIHMEDVGTVTFSESEVEALREYFLKGGFMWVDDFWGSYAWERWTEQIGLVLAPHQYPIVDVTLDEPIMHTLYDVKRMPQVPAISFWYQSGGRTSERGPDSEVVTFKGIHDEKGRLMVVMTHNTDIADTWEREGENREYFDLFSPEGYAIGVNFVLYALTH